MDETWTIHGQLASSLAAQHLRHACIGAQLMILCSIRKLKRLESVFVLGGPVS